MGNYINYLTPGYQALEETERVLSNEYVDFDVLLPRDLEDPTPDRFAFSPLMAWRNGREPGYLMMPNRPQIAHWRFRSLPASTANVSKRVVIKQEQDKAAAAKKKAAAAARPSAPPAESDVDAINVVGVEEGVADDADAELGPDALGGAGASVFASARPKPGVDNMSKVRVRTRPTTLPGLADRQDRRVTPVRPPRRRDFRDMNSDEYDIARELSDIFKDFNAIQGILMPSQREGGRVEPCQEITEKEQKNK